MAKTLAVEMVTPDKVALEGRVESIVLPAWDGEYGVLANHAPFLVQLKAGEVRVTENGVVRRFAISGGFAEGKENKVSLFAETADMAEALDAEVERQKLEKAKAEVVRRDLDPTQRMAAEAAMRVAQARLRVSLGVRRRQVDDKR